MSSIFPLFYRQNMINFTTWYAGLFALFAIIVKTKCDDDSCVPSPPTRPFQLNCGKNVIRVPTAKNFNFSIQKLNLYGCSKIRFHLDDWNGYENLEELIIGQVDVSSPYANLPLDKFSTLNLVKFTFIDSGLTDNQMWILPKTLQEYNVSNNRYTYLDVSMCSAIKIIDATNNKLTKLPTLSNPLPPLLSQIHLRDNPLHQLTVEQLAPLCNLSIFNWQMPQSSYLATRNATCSCSRLQKWSQLFQLRLMEVQCGKSPQEMECDLSFASVKYLRAQCSDADRIPDPASIPQIEALPKTLIPPDLEVLSRQSMDTASRRKWQGPFVYIIATFAFLLVLSTMTYVAYQLYHMKTTSAAEEQETSLDDTENNNPEEVVV